jgi:hypothetical protein
MLANEETNQGKDEEVFTSAHTCNEDDEDKQQNAVERVVFAAPNRGEDIVQLYGDGAEWQKATSNQVHRQAAAPGGDWDFACHILSAARSLESTFAHEDKFWEYLKLPAVFLPTIPPRTVRGNPMHNQMRMSRMMVVAGSACVDPWYHAKLLTKLQMTKNGTVNTHDVATIFHAQFCRSKRTHREQRN